eukprot:gene22413-30665_t
MLGNNYLTNPYILSSTVSLSYVVFYTGYDKASKSFAPNNILDLFLARRGIDWTLVEINKALSLSALTTMLLSFLPSDVIRWNEEKDKRTLLWVSMNMLWIHAVYSSYKFYGFSPKRIWSDKAIKRLSIALGSLGNLALVAGFFGTISSEALILTGTALGISHFWTMEVDYKYKLQVRPYAYLPFPLAAAVLGYLGYKYIR